jgi:hypothetical protein
MRRSTFIFLLLAVLAGCRENANVADFWNTHSIDYSDIDAAQDQFAQYAEQAVAADEADALASLDVLFDRLKEDEVAYYVYTDWMDGAFYTPLSPCRNAALYGKAVDRIVSDGVLSEGEYARFLQNRKWINYNREGDTATVPGVDLDGRRTLVLLLDPGCPSCHQALTVLAENPEWADVRRVAVICAPGQDPDVPGWDYYFPEDATDVFDPSLTPMYFVISADGLVESTYQPAL